MSVRPFPALPFTHRVSHTPTTRGVHRRLTRSGRLVADSFCVFTHTMYSTQEPDINMERTTKGDILTLESLSSLG